MVTRLIPNERKAKRIGLLGWAHGVHTKSFYKRLAGAVDGNLDVRVIERDDGVKNLFRVRSLKGQPHDARWHEIEIIKRRSNADQLVAQLLVNFDSEFRGPFHVRF